MMEMIKMYWYICAVLVAVLLTVLSNKPNVVLSDVRGKSRLLFIGVIGICILYGLLDVVHAEGNYIGTAQEIGLLQILNISKDIYELLLFVCCRILAVVFIIMSIHQFAMAYGLTNFSIIYGLLTSIGLPVYATSKWNIENSLLLLVGSCLMLTVSAMCLYRKSKAKMVLMMLQIGLMIVGGLGWGIVNLHNAMLVVVLAEIVVLLAFMKKMRILRNGLRRFVMLVVAVLMAMVNANLVVMF